MTGDYVIRRHSQMAVSSADDAVAIRSPGDLILSHLRMTAPLEKEPKKN